MTSTQERLRILATSDVHMNMMAFNYYENSPAPGIGLSALADTIAGLRDAALNDAIPRHVVLVDNGDLLQGTPLADFIVKNKDALAAFSHVLREIGYDAIGLGNHDLDFGLEHVTAFSDGLDIPVISSNLSLVPKDAWPKPYTLITRGALTIGLISVLPAKTLDWTYPFLGGRVDIDDMQETVRSAAEQARNAGADIVIALAHTGFGGDPRENALPEIAKDGAVDALIGGHTHQIFPSETLRSAPGADVRQGTLFGVPTVMPGFGGALLGCIDLDLSQSDSGWTVCHANAWVAPARNSGPMCAAVVAPLLPAHIATCQALDAPIGETNTPLTSYFAQVAPSDLMALCAGAQHAAIDHVRQGTPYADLPLLSVCAPTRAGGRAGPWNYCDIPAGPLKERNLADMSVFENVVWGVDVTGAELRMWLEHAAAGFHHLGHDNRGLLINTNVPAFNFDTIFGLTYCIDPTRPAATASDANAGRIFDMAMDGNPVADTDRFLVAVNSYRACGGGDFPGLHPDRPVLRPRLKATHVLRDYIRSGQKPDFVTPWRFSDCAKGVECTFMTGPGAIPYLEEIAHLSPGPPQLQSDGFVAIPVTL